MAAPSMNQLAEDYADRGVGSIFLYTNEAHPGENYAHHQSMEDKFRTAAELRLQDGVTRPIFLDALTGECHMHFGSMPNMTWILNKRMIPIYKSDWTNAESVRNALEYFVQLPERRKAGETLVPFQVERLDYKDQNQKRFYERLARYGDKSVTEFRESMKAIGLG
jgi:hypothetical protein